MHGTEPWEGDRLAVSTFTTGGLLRLTEQDRQDLVKLGFPLPEVVPRGASGLDPKPHAADHNPKSLDDDSSKAAAMTRATEASAEAAATDNQHHQTPNQNLETPKNVGHKDFWDEICDAQAEQGQGSFGLEGISRVLFGEVVEIPDGDAPVTETEHHGGKPLDEPSGDADLFDLAAYQQALEVLKKKCPAGCYDKDCEACVRARGAVRPHRSISDDSKSHANLSLDISGPHVTSADQMKYILIGVYRMPNGKNLYYAEPTKTKHASTVAEATVRIMAQLASLQVPPAFRLHTDCGREFEAQLFKELGTRFSTFHTQSAPYNPQSNGRVERGVQALKQAAIRELVHSGLSPTYWTYAVQNAALYSRMRAMGISVPTGTPRMGDWVAIQRHDAGDFEERAKCGVFIGHNVSSVHGSWILCMVNGRLKMVRARLPVLLSQPAVRWKVSVDPSSDRRVWVGQ